LHAEEAKAKEKLLLAGFSIKYADKTFLLTYFGEKPAN